MDKISLSDVTSLNAVATINSNFDEVESILNERVLFRDTNSGETNTVEDDIDFNGKRIYNLPVPVLDHEPVRLKELRDAVLGESAVVGGVTSVNGRTGEVDIESADVTDALGYVPVDPANAALSGNPTAPTQSTSDNSTKIATTAYVKSLVSSSVAGVSSFNSRTGAVSLTGSDVSTALGYTPASLVSPAFSGTPTAPTQASSDNSTKVATTAYVKSLISGAGVTSFNGRAGVVSLADTDVTNSLVASNTTKNIIWNAGVAGSVNAGDSSSLYIQRNASYSGGTAGQVNSAIYIETYTPAANASYEWGITSAMHSYSNNLGSGGAAAYPQNVAINGTVWKHGTAPVWAGNFAAYDPATSYSASSGPVHGAEFNVGISGTDPGESTIGVYVAAQSSNSGYTASMYAAILTGGSSAASWRYGVVDNYATYASFASRSTVATFGALFSGNYQVGIDLSTATNATAALRIKANDFIDLDATSAIRMKYNPTSGFIEFYNGSLRKGYINMSGGDALMNQSSSSFVDLTGTQTISGNKTFSGTNWFQNLLYATGGVNTGSGTWNLNSAGNYYATAGSLSGYLRVVVDGTTYKIPLYNV